MEEQSWEQPEKRPQEDMKSVLAKPLLASFIIHFSL